MELRHLRYFCVVAEELNLTCAAKRLHMSQPPLSRQIKQLEQEVGVELFERSSRGLRLTPSGIFFQQRALEILEKVDVTIDTTRHMARSKRTLFGIGFVPSIFYGQIPMLVRDLRQIENVEISLTELTTIQQVQALKAGRIDMGFGRLRIDDPDVEQEILFNEPFIAALPSGHPLEGTTPTCEELARYPLILFPAKPRPSLADMVLGIFRRQGLKVEIIQEANEVQTALSLVASGIGITLVPEEVKRVQRDGISYVALADKTITSPVVCSRRRGEKPSPLMNEATTILHKLVDDRFMGRYP
ncbi:LysR family transcriptional regulator [Halomonas sp. SpR1]|uniref:LysR family transcriptional regulator n=1 Tax=Halomonas sp. SpR1 TaxID=3050462 RepID=UPI0027E48E0C|nr:LysR family transcriptional regulator [Halomonas sp. SpR1]MDQ7731898.1 LysR family transcriptional regulator [Halomonas sp. SpR1]